MMITHLRQIDTDRRSFSPRELLLLLLLRLGFLPECRHFFQQYIYLTRSLLFLRQRGSRLLVVGVALVRCNDGRRKGVIDR